MKCKKNHIQSTLAKHVPIWDIRNFNQHTSLRAENTMSYPDYQKPMPAKEFRFGDAKFTTPKEAVESLLSPENHRTILDKMDERKGNGYDPVPVSFELLPSNVTAAQIENEPLWKHYTDKIFTDYHVALDQGDGDDNNIFTIIITAKQPRVKQRRL